MAEDTTPAEETVAVTVTEEKIETKEEIPDAAVVVASEKADKMKHGMLPLTIFSFLLSLPIIFLVIWLLYMREYDCENLLDLPKLQLGIVIGLTVVFFVSNFVVRLRSRIPVPGLVLVMVLLTLMLIVGLGLVGTFNMETRKVPGSPRWLKMKVDDNYNWDEIKSCIYDTTTCKDLFLGSYMLKPSDFTASKLSSIESGCCVPPSSCEMEYVNVPFWRKTDAAIDSSIPLDMDCDLWHSDETILCYNCQACREGFLKPLRDKWHKIGAFLIVMSALLIFSHLLLFLSTMWEQLRG